MSDREKILWPQLWGKDLKKEQDRRHKVHPSPHNTLRDVRRRTAKEARAIAKPRPVSPRNLR